MLPLLAFGVFAAAAAALLLAMVAAPLFLMKLPQINAAAALEPRLARLEADIDRLSRRLRTLEATVGVAPPVTTPAPALQAPGSQAAASQAPASPAPATHARPSSAPAAPVSAARETAREDARTIPADAAPGIEERLGANWLNKAGASILVLGIAFFLAYHVGRFGPAGKDLLGYTSAAALLSGGVWLERRGQYQLFSRGLIAGGWALTFFTTYAINHVPAARILASTSIDLLLMLAVAGAMVAHTLRYRSQAITGLAFGLAFLTVTISHDTVLSLSAGLVLACASVVVANRMRWHALELGAIAGTYLNHLVWVTPATHHQPLPTLSTSVMMLATYWTVFRTAYIARASEKDAGERWSALAAVLNAGLLVLVLRYQTTSPELAFRALLVLGIAEAALAQLPRVRARRVAFATLTTLGVTLLAAALPFRFGGARLTLLWLAQAEALVFIAAWMRDALFHRLGAVAAWLAGVYLLALASGWLGAHAVAGVGTHALALTLLAAAGAFYANAHYVPRRWASLFAHPFDRRLAIAFSCAASVFVLLAARRELPPEQVVVGWAAMVVLLLMAATTFARRLFAGQAILGAVAVVARGVLHNLYARRYFPGQLTLSPEFTVGASALLLLASLPMAFHLRDEARRRGDSGPLATLLARPEQVLFFSALTSITWLLAVRLPAGLVTVGWGIEAVAAFLLALCVKERTFRLSAVGLLIVCVARIVAVDVWSLDARDRYLTLIGVGAALLVVSFLYSRYRALVRAHA